MSKPTDIEVLASILADFPTDASTLSALQNRLARLLSGADAAEDGTIDYATRERAKVLNNALIDMWWVVDCIENNKSPWCFQTAHPPYNDDIPF